MAKPIPQKAYRLKYNLEALLLTLTHRKRFMTTVLSHLEKHGISKTVFYSDKSIPYGSERSIPADRLLTYAQLFNTTMELLINDHRPVAKSLSSYLEGPVVRWNGKRFTKRVKA